MKCPHCAISFHDQWSVPWTGANDPDNHEFELRYCTCSACKKRVFVFRRQSRGRGWLDQMVYPRGALRPLAAEVKDPYAGDFREAVEVLPISAKASAALSRGNLQALLRDVHGVKHGMLSKEIEEFVARPSTPALLRDVIDAVRNVGNFAAHPTKDTNTGALIEVESHEAEWLLEVLEAMFDFTFVQPAQNAARKAALNAKLAAAGKPPMK